MPRQVVAAPPMGTYSDRPSARPVPVPESSHSDETSQFVLPPVPESPAADQGVEQYLAITRIQLIGNTVLPQEVFDGLLHDYQDRTVSLAEVETLRQALTQLYVVRGYINSGAIIFENDYRDGVLTIHLVEGHLDEVRIKGTERLRSNYVANRLWPHKGRVFNVNKLEERYQRLLNDPLIARMNGQLLPGDEMGRAILDVEVTRARPYQLSVFANNYRPPSIGSEAFGLTGVVRNLTGWGDALDFTYLNSGGSNRYAGGWTVPLNDFGTEFFFRFDEGESSVVEEPVAELHIESQVHSLEGGVSQAVINRLNQRLDMGLSFGVRANETTLLNGPFAFLGGNDTEKTQATVLRFFQDYFTRWDQQILALRSTMTLGIDALGATPERLPDNADSEFFAWLGQLQFARQIAEDGTQLVIRGSTQFSNEPVLPLEQIAVGGVGTVRGYRENYLVRDNGYAFSLELHHPIRFDVPITLTLVPFFDVGSAWNHDPSQKTATLCSLGVGVNVDYRAFHTEFFYGHAFTNPLQTERGDLQDEGLHFQARLDLF